MDPKNKITTELDQVLSSLQQLNISASVNNMSTLLACMKMLASIRQEISQMENKEDTESGES